MPIPPKPCVRHLLVSHDLSLEADWALRRALQLARETGAHVTLAHATNTPDLAQAEQRLRAHLLPFGAFEWSLCVRQSPLIALLKTLLESTEADLLLLGHAPKTHSAQSAAKILAAEAVLAEQKCPILWVCHAEPRPYQRALAAIDFSNSASQAAKTLLGLLSEPAELHILNVLERAEVHPPTAADMAIQHEQLHQWQCHHLTQGLPSPPRLTPIIRHGERHRCLEDYLQTWKPHVLAMGIHGQGLLRQTLGGSLALELLSDPPCDLLLASASSPRI